MLSLFQIIRSLLLISFFSFSAFAQYGLPDDRYQGFGYLFLGAEQFDFGDISTRLSDADYPELADKFITIGGGGLFFARRLIIGGEGAAIIKRTTDDATQSLKLSSSGSYGLLSLGFSILNNNSIRLYPLAGIGAGISEISLRQNNNLSFDELLATPGVTTSLSQTHLLISTAIGIDIPIATNRKNKMAVGIRFGYNISAYSSDWKADDVSLTGSPVGDMSGPFIKILLGTGR